MERRTSANTVPNLIAFPTTLSDDSLISGEYSFSNPSSTLNEERRDSLYAKVISRLRWRLQRDEQ